MNSSKQKFCRPVTTLGTCQLFARSPTLGHRQYQFCAIKRVCRVVQSASSANGSNTNSQNEPFLFKTNGFQYYLSQAVAQKNINGINNSNKKLPESLKERILQLLQSNQATQVKSKLIEGLKLFNEVWPMGLLFFLMTFVNTILDSMKDTLVVTAVGGGAQVIPYLTVYAVLPASILFLVGYTLLSQKVNQEGLFNIIIGLFGVFFMIFAFTLYPNHEALHLHEIAQQIAPFIPSGLQGMIGMFRNWTFTLFYVMSELWGDVGLSLLFYGLANEITSKELAPSIYPLFGIGANVAQVIAGLCLKGLGSAASHGQCSFAREFQVIMSIVSTFILGILGMHFFICRTKKKVNSNVGTDNSTRSVDIEQKNRDDGYRQNQHGSNTYESCNGYREPNIVNGRLVNSHYANSARFDERQSLERAFTMRVEINGHTTNTALSKDEKLRPVIQNGHYITHQRKNNRQQHQSYNGKTQQKQHGKKKPKLSTWQAMKVVMASKPIQCLAIMTIAQGITINLMGFVWKIHLKMLHPDPATFSQFLGDVAAWTGWVTGSLMLLAPYLFKRFGWKGVASTTPMLLTIFGTLFFAASFLHLVVPAFGTVQYLQYLTIGGALLYIIAKGAKFSLFKPAEEMVFITLDETSRTKGKAAIDVVGVQIGKSGVSVLQQALLLMFAGSMLGSLPAMCVIFFFFLRSWVKAVQNLADDLDFEGQSESSSRRKPKDPPPQPPSPQQFDILSPATALPTAST